MPLPLLFAQAAHQQGFDMREFVDSLARTPLSKITIITAVCTVLRLAIFKPFLNTPRHRRTGLYSLLNVVNEVCDLVVYAAVFVFLLIRPFVGQAFVIPSGSMVPNLLVGDYIGINKAIFRYTDPKHGDIVVFRPPTLAVLEPAKQLDADGEVKIDFIKRCIGLPGDVIEQRKNKLFVNGVEQPEPYVHYTKSTDSEENFPDLTKEEMANQTLFDFKLIEHDGKVIPVRSINGEYYSRETPPELQPKDAAEAAEFMSAKPAKIPAGYYLFMGDNRNFSYDGRCWGLVPRASVVGRSEFIWMPIARIRQTR